MGKNQHYIPQFYLKNFSDENQKAIGIFIFGNRKLVPHASIRKIAYRHRYYDEDNLIEKGLAEEEGKWKFILDCFLGRNVSSSTVELFRENSYQYLTDLLHFMCITESRTAQRGDSLKYIYNTLEKYVIEEMPLETYNRYFNGMDNFLKHPNILLMQEALRSIPFYAGLELLVIYNCSSRLFVTSDVPVININPYYEKRKYARSFGLVATGLQKLLPISGRVCLCLYDRNVYKRRCKDPYWNLKSKRTVHQLNKLAVENAYEQVFFSVFERNQYIKKLCLRRKASDNKGRINFFGDLIHMHEKQIIHSFLLPCLRFNKSTLHIPLPEHMGGLVRHEVQSLYDEMKK